MRTWLITSKNVIAQAARLGTQGLAQLVVSILIAHWVGLEGLGIYAFVSSVLAVAAIFSDMGLTLFLSAEVARKPELVSRYVNQLLPPASLLGLLLALITFSILQFVMKGTQVGWTASACAVVLLIAGPASALRGAVYAFEKMEYDFYAMSLQEILFVSGVAVLLVLRFPFAGVFLLLIVTRLVGFFFMLFLYHCKIAPLGWEAGWQQAREAVVKVLPYSSNALSGVLFLRADSLLLYLFMGATTTGLYEAVANVSFRLAILFPRLVATALLPSLSRWFVKESPTQTREFPKLFLYTIAVGTGVCLPFLVFAPQIMEFTYGPKLAGGVPLLRLLSLGIPLHYASMFCATLLTAADLQFVRTKNMAWAAFTCLGLDTLLIPQLGVYGAIAALLISHAVWLLLSVFYSARLIRSRTAIFVVGGHPIDEHCRDTKVWK